MGVIPVPEEMRNMHEKVNRIVETLHNQDRMLEKMEERIATLKSDGQKLAEMGRELQEIRNALAIIKDAVRFDRVA